MGTKVEYQTLTVSFFGTVAAGVEATLVSKAISRSFRLSRVRAHFPLGTDKTLQLEFFISPDDAAPASGKPTGFNVLEQTGQVSYIVGDDGPVIFDSDAYASTSPAWVKVYANNTDAFAHTIDVQVRIHLYHEED